MNYPLFIGTFAVLSIFYTIFGYNAAQKLQNLDDYFLAQRNLGILSLAIALIGVHFGGGVIFATSEASYTIGLYGLHYVVGICIGFIILAAGVASRMQRLGITTVAEVFTIRYHSPMLKYFCSLLSIMSLIGILLAQMVGTRTLMISLDVYSAWLYLLFWAVIIGYTMAGGLSAIIKSNVFQIIFISCVFLALFGYEIITNLPFVLHTLSQPEPFVMPDIFSMQDALTIVVMPACYMLIEQDIAQNIFAARTQRIAFISALIASVFMLSFCIIPAYFGMKTQLLGLTPPEGGQPLLYLFDQQYTPFIVVLAVYGIFAASISTADTMLCAITSHLVTDFNLQMSTPRGSVRLAQALTLCVGVSACIGSLYAKDLLTVLKNSYTLPIATIFVPLVIAYFTESVSRYAAYASVIAGLIGIYLFKTQIIIYAVPPEISALLASAIAYGITWGLTYTATPSYRS